MACDTGEPNPLQPAAADASIGWREKIESEYRRLKEHAETYPLPVCVGIVHLGLRRSRRVSSHQWRKLRRTEDRVRVLQGLLRELVEAEESAARASSQFEQPQPTPPSESTPPRPKEGKSDVK